MVAAVIKCINSPTLGFVGVGNIYLVFEDKGKREGGEVGI